MISNSNRKNSLSETIYRRLRMDPPSINCPEGKKVTQMCINPECSTSLRCNYLKCGSCGPKIHDSCFCVSLEEVSKLFNFKVDKWTEILANIFEQEEKVIQRIRENQNQFVGQFFQFQLKSAGLQYIKNFHKNRKSNYLSGQSAMNMIQMLQRRLKINEKQISNKIDLYSTGLSKYTEEINAFRYRNFISIDLNQKVEQIPKLLDPEVPEVPEVLEINEMISVDEQQEWKKLQQGEIMSIQQNYRQGNALMHAKKYTESVESYHITLQMIKNERQLGNNLYSDDSRVQEKVYINMGLAYRSLHMYEKAINSEEAALKINPNHSWAHFNLGQIFSQIKQFQKALQSFKNVLRINPNFDSIFTFTWVQQTINQEIKNTVQKNPKSTSPLLNLGIVLNSLQRYQEAIKSFQNALLIEPNNLKVLHNLGRTLNKVGKYEQAIRLFNKILDNKPNDLKALIQIAQAYTFLGKHEKAIISYQRYLQIDPKQVKILIVLGLILQDNRRHEEAVKVYQKILQIQPNNISIYQILGVIHNQIGNYKQAIVCYNKVIELNPNISLFYEYIKMIFLEKHQQIGEMLDDEIRFVRNIIAKNPDNHQAKETLLKLKYGFRKRQK